MPAKSPNWPPEIIVRDLGGNCPVEAEGWLDGAVPFYFRARGASWSITVGWRAHTDCAGWEYREAYGTWPEAGWMDHDDAFRMIQRGALIWAQCGRKVFA